MRFARQIKKAMPNWLLKRLLPIWHGLHHRSPRVRVVAFCRWYASFRGLLTLIALVFLSLGFLVNEIFGVCGVILLAFALPYRKSEQRSSHLARDVFESRVEASLELLGEEIASLHSEMVWLRSKQEDDLHNG